MANTNLTPTIITKKALAILHQKLNFVGTINRQYDSRFAQSGAKIGDTLTIRKPNKYTIRTGAVMNTQDVAEPSTTLQVASQAGVDLNFTMKELTMDIDNFSEIHLEPAMATLAAYIESQAYSMYKDVPNIIDGDAAALTLLNILQGGAKLTDNLTPKDNNRIAMLSTTHTVKLINDTKALFHDSTAIAKQYREGVIGRTGGFDFYENTHVGSHTTGTAAKTTGYTVNGATQSGATITIQTGTTSFLKGDIVTFAGCYDVHPETKVTRANLKQFVVTADSGTSATSLAISPSLTVSGAFQNCSAYPTDTGAVVKVAAGASETINTSMVYHRDAFAFATADLMVPKGVHFAAREVYDGVSMRLVQAYDIVNDKLPCRVDVLFG